MQACTNGTVSHDIVNKTAKALPFKKGNPESGKWIHGKGYVPSCGTKHLGHSNDLKQYREAHRAFWSGSVSVHEMRADKHEDSVVSKIFTPMSKSILQLF